MRNKAMPTRCPLPSCPFNRRRAARHLISRRLPRGKQPSRGAVLVVLVIQQSRFGVRAGLNEGSAGRDIHLLDIHLAFTVDSTAMATPEYPKPYTNYGQAEFHKLVLEAPGVLRVSFARGKVNAWITPMYQELRKVFDFIRTDADVSAIVLSGENRCFTAGLDCEWKPGLHPHIAHLIDT